METYCLFVQSACESAVIARLVDMGLQPYAPLARHMQTVAGQKQSKLKRLLPGYVFFEADKEPTWHEISRIHGVIRRLCYPDGTYCLRHDDLLFVAWIKNFGSVVEVSHAIKEGTKVLFTDGPLKALAGLVCKVNKKRGCAAIRFGSGESLFGMVWCPFEMIESSAITDADEQLSNAPLQ